MTGEPLDVRDGAYLLRRHWRMILAGALLGGALGAAAAPLVPGKYKSRFVLAIYSKYFQSPLLGDFVPGLAESQDGGDQRDALIRQALTPRYLDALAQRCGLRAGEGAPESPAERLRSLVMDRLADLGLRRRLPAEARLSEQRQALKARIEVLSLNGTTFDVAFSDSGPDRAYAAAQDLHDEIVRSLLEVRKGILITVRASIQKRLEELSAAMAAPAPRPPTPAERELAAVREELGRVLLAYTPAHPKVRRLRARERTLVRLLGGRSEGRAAAVSPGKVATAAEREVAADLVKKLNYLDIAIDSDQQRQGDYFATLESPAYPTASLGPSRALLPVAGLVFGAACGVFIAALKEYLDRCAVRTAVLARRLGVPVLGELPLLP